MHITLARHLAHLARAAYLPEPEAGMPPGKPVRLDPFATRSFRGLAVSDHVGVHLVFRGTKGETDEPVERQLAAWLTNIDFTQVPFGGYRVHRGFAGEVEASLDQLEGLARQHGAGRRPLYLTGHSAGGALATLAAPRLLERGLPVKGSVVFAAPRVGDKAFAATYPLPLWRVETGHDIVPHLPLPPSLALSVGRLLLDPLLQRRARRHGIDLGGDYRMAQTEYAHAGELFYDDGRAALYRVPPGQFWRRFGPILGAELRADLARRGAGPTAAAYLGTGCPDWATPVPARLLDAVRFSATLREVMRQLQAGTRDFIVDHHIDAGLSFLERLALPRP